MGQVQISKTKLSVVLLFLLILIASGIFYMNKNLHRNSVLRVSYRNYWVQLVPCLQHTAVEDALLSNQYDSLVDIGANGLIIPNGALSWTVSEDFKKFVFKIDKSKTFSNGIHLKAQHFKDSWEYGLKLQQKSHNKSAIDGIYQLEGFDDFEKTGSISGIKVLSDDVLELNYKTSFRQAMEHLAGSRFSAFLVEGGKYIGTGRYVIEETEYQRKVLLVPQKYHEDFSKLNKITVESLDTLKAISMLKTNELDLIQFSRYIDDSSDGKTSGVENIIGQDSSHQIIGVNGKKGRFFEKKEYRLAFQSLVADLFKEKANQEKLKTTEIDPQVYLPFQKGRLDISEVEELLKVGRSFKDEMIRETKNHPLFFVTSDERILWIFEKLKEIGIVFTKNSGLLDWGKAIDMAYNSSEMDLFLVSIGLVSGDPDGLYHALGKKGAILFPMQYRDSIANLLEEGRQLLSPEEIHNYYKKVSREVLKEVPFVHIGFLKDIVIYNKNRVEVTQIAKDRNYFKLHIYQLK